MFFLRHVFLQILVHFRVFTLFRRRIRLFKLYEVRLRDFLLYGFVSFIITESAFRFGITLAVVDWTIVYFKAFFNFWNRFSLFDDYAVSCYYSALIFVLVVLIDQWGIWKSKLIFWYSFSIDTHQVLLIILKVVILRTQLNQVRVF